jgi:hypothetical protein
MDDTPQLESVSLSSDQYLAIAKEAQEARLEFQRRQMSNTPADLVEFAIARLEYEKARFRMEKADRRLFDATQQLSREHP